MEYRLIINFHSHIVKILDNYYPKYHFHLQLRLKQRKYIIILRLLIAFIS